MINVKIVACNINYDKTVVGLYPMLMEKCRETENPGLLVRFLLKMGHAARKIMREILGRFSDDTMAELFCSIVWKYDKAILDALARTLEKNEIGRYIHVGGIAAMQGMNGQITLEVQNVTINYNGIVRSSAARQKIRKFTDQHMLIFGGIFSKFLEGGAKLLADNFSSQFEKLAVSQIEKAENKRKLMDFLFGMLEKNKISLELAEVSFTQSSAITMQWEPQHLETQPGGQLFSYDLEEKLLDTVTQYLKMLAG